MALTSFFTRQVRITVAIGAGIWLCAPSAYAQLDPLNFLKRTPPNVLLVVDTANRMQRDAPTDPANPLATSNYYDPFLYPTYGTWWEAPLGVTGGTKYRRRYGTSGPLSPYPSSGACPSGAGTCGLTYASGGSGDKFNAGTIAVVTDQDPTGYAGFESATRLSIARAALYQAVNQNKNVARFGLLKTRQNSPSMPATSCSSTGSCQVNVTDPAQSGSAATETGSGGRWYITRPTVSSNNTAANASTALIVKADSASANADVLTVLGKTPRDSASGGLSPLIPAGNDDVNTVDAPLNLMLTDTSAEADRLLKNDPNCMNTVVVLVVGGGDGAGTDLSAAAKAFITPGIDSRRIPIYVIALAPPSADRAGLQAIASNSGGLYFEITKSQIDAALRSQMWSAAVTGAPAGTVVVPEAVKAINVAIQAAFENFEDLNTKALIATPLPAGVSSVIPISEFQVSSPIIGTTNLQGATDATGATLTPDPTTIRDRAGNVIPQRSNLMVTSAFTLPGFDGKVRAFRVYKPQADATQQSGYKFVADGTPLWSAGTPAADSRNLFTTLADGSMIEFKSSNVAQLASLMNLNATDAVNVINLVRAQPLGTILDSTPAIVNPPSLDPPPDDTYPAFAAANRDRRTLVFFGTNRGVLEAIDARTGLEVWGYIPMNLLPKLRTLWDGQAVGAVDFLMDGSPKVADIKWADGSWHTFMFIGQGAGGTFYQALDLTLSGMAASVAPTDDTASTILSFFSVPTRIPVRWSYPLLSDFEPNCNNLGVGACTTSPYGDLKSTATAVEKTMGQTWSDPAIGQVMSPVSPYVMLTGSGYFPYSTQQQPNRGGTVAGTTFYMLKAEDGTLLDSKSVGSDGQYETQDNCVTSNDCTQFKNALQSDPVATGPSDSRYITKSYIADLDGRIWRFDISLNSSNKPIFNSGTNPVKLYDDPLKQPIFSSMATVNVGGTQQYIFAGTGNDLLPQNGVSQQYRLLGVLDNGGSGTKTFEVDLNKVDGNNGDEKVTAFPAVAGDIVFFTTTTFNPASPCTLPTASLYALTFIGGAAYDTNADGKFDNKDTTLVKSIAGVRATAPFIVDQHLVFGAGGKVQMFGDMADFNNGIGQAGVRILSWREAR